MVRKFKQGITIASLVIYLILFSTLTIVVSLIYTNMNDTLFLNRGRAINDVAFNKLQYNITNSALSSNNIEITSSNVIKYSNGDIYEYDEEAEIILLNGGILCSNVSAFSTSIHDNDGVKMLNLNVSFNKYLNTLDKKIISSIEVN